MPGGILPPLSVEGSWPTPNYVNPVERNWDLVVVAVLLTTTSFLVVCARLWARLKLRSVGIDDVIIILTMPSAIAMSVLICLLSRRYGFNRHIWDVPVPVGVKGRRVVMAIEGLYVFATGSTKVSILLFYRRLVSGSVSRTFVWALFACIFSVAAYMITFEITLICGCRPLSAYWNQVDPIWRTLNANKYVCLDEVKALYAANIISILQDFLTFLMPLLLFWTLRLPKRQKFVLGCIFGVGFFICIVGIIRLAYTEAVYYQTYDVTWASQPIWLWTIVELHGAIICASAPALKVFFDRFFKVIATQTGTAYSRGSRPDGSRRLRDTEDGSEFAMVSQRSGGGKTQSEGHTVAEYESCVEKMDVEEWVPDVEGDGLRVPNTSPDITALPVPPVPSQQRSGQRSWYDD